MLCRDMPLDFKICYQTAQKLSLTAKKFTCRHLPLNLFGKNQQTFIVQFLNDDAHPAESGPILGRKKADFSPALNRPIWLFYCTRGFSDIRRASFEPIFVSLKIFKNPKKIEFQTILISGIDLWSIPARMPEGQIMSCLKACDLLSIYKVEFGLWHQVLKRNGHSKLQLFRFF